MVEAADPDGDRVDRPPADERDEVVAGLLEPERPLDEHAVVAGQLDRARVAQEVRGVEEVDVERVALDPLAAVEQAAQGADGRVELDAGGVLEGVDGAHLVGDRADAADAGDDVEDLVRRPAADQPLEVARRLEDAEVRLDDLAVLDDEPERALALDAGEALDLEGLGLRSAHGGRHRGSSEPRVAEAGVAPGGPPWASTTERNGSAQTVNPAKRAATSASSNPGASAIRPVTLASPRGPKQP